MYYRINRLFQTGLVSLCLCLTPLTHAAGSIKCWTNNDGVRECGTVIPPEYIKKEHEVLNIKGSMIQKEAIEAAKTEEERAAIIEEQRRVEEERKILEEKAREERALLDAYPTESDIRLAKEGKLASVEAGMKVMQTNLEYYQKSLDDTNSAVTQGIMTKESAAKAIKNLEGKVAQFQGIIAEKQQEMQAITTEYDAIIVRYRQIKESIANQQMQMQNRK